MSVKQGLQKARPWLWGGAIGIVATLIVEFAAGWVVTTQTMQEKVAEAEVRVLANVCADRGRSYWTAQGHEIKALEGWDNQQREQIAERFTPELEKVDLQRVTSRCGQILNPGTF